ncbi:MAG TPA: JAB domain-containing protein [Hanamia sp.]|nr:JAB domain-containing protein [Hanamia sp.]
MQNQNVSFYKPTQFSPNEKGIENYQTIGKETIAYKKLFSKNFFDGRLDNKAGSNQIWSKENSFRPLAPKLKEGEFAVVERKYSEIGMFDFTTRDNNKINSHADVAYIFRQLESEAVEHAFAVYIDKESNPSVQWLSMGGINATIIDPRIMVDAAQRLEATQIYLVHNHPSGNLKPSGADLRIVEKLKKGFEPMGIIVNAIIINLNSGNYLIFDENGCTVEREGFTFHDFEEEKKVGVFSFNKQAFLQSPLTTIIQSPSDVAQFLSQQKFSSGEKAGYLLLTTRNEIAGNFFATQNTRQKAFKEVAGLVSKFGGVNVIAYTNKADNAQFYRDLKGDLTNLDISLLDVIECESSAFVCKTFDKYKSLVQQNRLYETSPEYPTNPPKFSIAVGMETQYDITFGHLGSGITVWDRQQLENGDYKTIAHISDNGEVDFYENDLPDDVKKKISVMAAIQEAKFDHIPLKPVMVIPLTEEQKNDMSQNPYYKPPRYGLPDLSPEQVASVPDVIEGHPLNYQDKLVLYESELQFEGEKVSYRIAENNTIVKEQDGMRLSILTHADVGFNDFELNRQNFENGRRRNQGPPQEGLWENNLSAKENQTIYITKKTKIMETQNTLTEEHLTSKGTEVNNKENYRQMNLDYLTNQVKFLGFGDGLGERLSEKMNELKDAIDLSLTQSFFVAGNPVKKQDVDFSLHFNKGKESEMYFLNSYSAQLKVGHGNNGVPQKFYINKGKGITAKESFNLLSGRAINKDFTNKAGETYNAWLKLKPTGANNDKGSRDFQMFGENYGFDLEKTLSKYPIKEMESPEAAERLMNSLKKGNMQAVTLMQNGEETSKFISANPQFKNLDVLNHNGSAMFHNDIELNNGFDTHKQNEAPKKAEAPVTKVVKSAGMKR